jgi:MFS family permease
LIRVPSGDPAAARDRVDPYAWVVVAVLAVTLTIASGARFLFGVVLKPISEEFGWNRAQLTGAVMLAMVVLSICQPVVGILVDRIAAKKILVGGIALLGVSLIPLSFATNLWQIYFLYGLLTSFGLAAASPVLATSIVGHWFTHKRGLAMSVATSGSAFGQLLIVPVATWIMLTTSWQTTYRVLAVALLAVAVPLAVIFLRDAPRAAVAAGEAPPPEEGLTLRDATAHPAFWILAFGFVVCGWTMAFPNTYRRTSVLALTYALRGLAFLLLLVLPAGNLLYVYGLVLGISWTATTPLTAAIAADRYGPKHLGFIFGCLFTFMNLGFGFGSFLGGVMFEVTGSYQLDLAVNVALGVAAAIAMSLVPYLGHERQQRPSPMATPETRSFPARATG